MHSTGGVCGGLSRGIAHGCVLGLLLLIKENLYAMHVISMESIQDRYM
jgi:hypothetical protein